MTTTNTTSRVAYCECGMGLSGDSGEALLKAAQLHIARDHDRLLHGGGSDDARRPIRSLYQNALRSLCRT